MKCSTGQNDVDLSCGHESDIISISPAFPLPCELSWTTSVERKKW